MARRAKDAALLVNYCLKEGDLRGPNAARERELVWLRTDFGDGPKGENAVFQKLRIE